MQETPSIAKYLRFGLLPLLVIVMTSISGDFLSAGNLFALGQTFAVIAPVALAIGLTMIAREFDLSVAAMVALAGLVMVKTGDQNPMLGLVITVGLGAMIGAVSAFLTLKLDISSLVVTLGIMIVLQGAAVWLEGGQTAIFNGLALTDFLGTQFLYVLSPLSVVAIGLGIILFVVLGFSRLGRDIYASGSSRKAALMSGARVRVSIFAVFMISGAFAALDGALMAISLGRASSQFGGNLLIQSVTAAILGGVALSGGVGTVPGILLGALTLSVLSNGLSFVGAGSATILLMNGAVLLAVVLFESDVTKRLIGVFGQRKST